MTTGYAPLDTLKPVAEGLWVIDGPAVTHHGPPWPTRATVVRLENGDLWVHAPTRLTDALGAELEAIGPVRHLIAPNHLHYGCICQWQAAFPEAVAWAAPGVAERAAKKGQAPAFDHDLGSEARMPWAGQIDGMIVAGSTRHREAVFFHRASVTLILTDLIVNVETARLPVWARPLAWIAGIDDSDGKMPPGMRLSFGKVPLAESVERMIAWGPERIILAHGRWYERDGVAELERAFRRILRDRQWERAMDEMQKHK